MTAGPNRGRAALIVCLVAALGCSLGPASASAEDPPAVPVTLTAITPVVRPGGQLDVSAAVPASTPVDGLEVAFKIGPAITSRDAFAQAARGKASPTALDFTTEPLVAGATATTATLSLRVVASGRNTADQVVLARPGVYPLTISVRKVDDSEELSSTVTFVVRGEASPPRNPLLFSWIWPVYQAPPPSPDPGAAATEERDAADLIAAMGAALAATSVPVTIWPVPATLDAARVVGTERLTATSPLQRLAQAAAGHEVLGGPYAMVATDAWAAMPSAVDPQYGSGRRVLADTLPGVAATTSVAVAVGQHAAPADLNTIADRGATGIVVDPGVVVDPKRKTTLTQRFRVNGVGGSTFARADPGLRDDIADGGGAVAAAQRLLADLFVLQQDSPSETRGALLLPDASWRPAPALLAEVSTRLIAADFVTPVGLAGFFQRVPVARDGDADLTLDTVSDEAGPPPEAAAAYAALSASKVRLDDLTAMLVPGQGPAPQVLEDATRTYLRGPDTTLVSTGASPAYAAAVDGAFTSVVDGIDVPADVSITLTSASARVPITLRNDNPFPVTVAIEFVPESAVTIEGATSEIVTLDASRSHTEEFPVETAGAGTFRVVVRVAPPNGGEVVRETHVELTAAGGRWVATALTIGSLVFLGLWWLWDIRSRSRRGKHTRGRGDHPAGSSRRRPAAQAPRRVAPPATATTTPVP